MKKLLALLLCVMLFAAVIPTNAFAGTTATGWADKAVSNTAVKEAQKSIKGMYTAIATDEFVFGTAKSLHDFADGLASSLFEGVDKITTRIGGRVNRGGRFVTRPITTIWSTTPELT